MKKKKHNKYEQSIPEEDAEARGVPLSLFLVLAPPSRVGEAGGLSSSLGLLLHLLFFTTGVAPLQPKDLVTNTSILICFFTKDCLIHVLELVCVVLGPKCVARSVMASLLIKSFTG